MLKKAKILENLDKNVLDFKSFWKMADNWIP